MTIAAAHFAAYSEPDFRSRVEFFILKASVAAKTEDPLTANHADRVILSDKILASPLSYVTQFGLAAMSNPTLLSAASHSAITDNDLEFAINSLYDPFTTG